MILSVRLTVTKGELYTELLIDGIKLNFSTFDHISHFTKEMMKIQLLPSVLCNVIF